VQGVRDLVPPPESEICTVSPGSVGSLQPRRNARPSRRSERPSRQQGRRGYGAGRSVSFVGDDEPVADVESTERYVTLVSSRMRG
jgi:hypothetical protein